MCSSRKKFLLLGPMRRFYYRREWGWLKWTRIHYKNIAIKISSVEFSFKAWRKAADEDGKLTKLLQTACHLSRGGTVGVTQGVSGLCLPWGFHTGHKSTLGMSHNQTHWLLLNWPAGPPLAHLGSSCLKTLQFTLALHSLPFVAPVVWPGRGADTVTHPPLMTTAVPCRAGCCKNTALVWANNGSQSGRWGPVSWQVAVACRWEMLHVGVDSFFFGQETWPYSLWLLVLAIFQNVTNTFCYQRSVSQQISSIRLWRYWHALSMTSL